MLLKATLAAAAAGLGGFVLLKLASPTPLEDEESSATCHLPLQEWESSRMMLEQPAITTLTFFEGDPSSGALFLRQRVADIIRANPWLAGRLSRPRHSKRVLLSFDPNPVDPGANVFQVASPHPSMTRDAPQSGFARHAYAQGLIIGKGIEAVNKRKPNFAVTLIPDAKAPSSRFAVIVSMGHTLGDGHTYYSVLKMLTKGGEVARLNAERREDMHRHVLDVLGGPNLVTRPRSCCTWCLLA
mmetsp:Transcript_16868/g.42549  ORF Transcript_16868/g.42549 Transcript_16868/m.42549 type:complete len:242 (+) Transcript_16868:93-818(+)